MTTDLASKAMRFAEIRHAGQKYGLLDYCDAHLAKVALCATVFAPADVNLTAAAWLHDVVEDTPTTLDEIRETFGEDVANLVWAVTSAPGENRKERNAATYPKIREAGARAVALKLCDRIVNVESCWLNRDAKLFMYKREHRDFRHALFREEDGLHALWDPLDRMLGEHKSTAQ